MLFALVVLTAFAAPAARAQGCSMCREATGGADDPLGRALHWSTLFMVTMPFVVVALIAGYLGLAQRRSARRQPDSTPLPIFDRHPQSTLSSRRNS